MSMEGEALKEIDELRAQVNAFRLIPHVCGGVTCAHCNTGNKTATQCLKQHDIDFIKSLIQEFADGCITCEDVLLNRLNKMEAGK